MPEVGSPKFHAKVVTSGMSQLVIYLLKIIQGVLVLQIVTSRPYPLDYIDGQGVCIYRNPAHVLFNIV